MTFTTFIKRPVLSTVISVLMVILGLIGLVTLPIEQYPDIAPPTVVVYTTYQGADAETVKNSVLAPLEESINGVENMTYMTSSASNSGSAQIQIYFRQGTNADMCAVNVQNRVSQAQALLPAEVTRVGVTVMKRQTSHLQERRVRRRVPHQLCQHQHRSGPEACRRCGRRDEPRSENIRHAYMAEARCDEAIRADAYRHKRCSG